MRERMVGLCSASGLPALIGAVMVFGVISLSLLYGDEVTTIDGKKHQWQVLKVTAVGIMVREGTEQRLVKWEELEPASAYEYRKRLVKEKDAADHLSLARFCLEMKLWDRAREAAVKAKEIDQGVTEEADKLIAQAEAKVTRAELTPEQLKDILEEQRGRSIHIQEVVAQPVEMIETDHFIIYTTFPKGDHKLFQKICEKLYTGFDKVFDISKNQDRMWDGKAVVYLFKERKEFVVFSNAVHSFPGEMAGGYFRAQGGHCEIVIPKDGDLEDFLSTFVHEGAHAFLHFYRDNGRVPRWVHEGVAQYFEFEEFPKSSQCRRAIRLVQRNLKDKQAVALLELDRDDRPFSGLDYEGYAYSHSYVYFLVRTSGKQFAEFIRTLKGGMGPDEALQKAYGWDMETTQKKWAAAMMKTLR